MEWHDISDANDPELDQLAERYHLHPLHIEDCRHRNQNAKVEAQNGYLFIVLKPIELKEPESLTIGDFDVFLGKDFLITVQELRCDSVTRTLERQHTRKEDRRSDQMFYRLMDGIVDAYVPVLDQLNDRIDEIEDTVLTDPTPEMLQRIFSLRRCLIEMRRTLVNMRDVSGHLMRDETKLIAPDMWPFLRDVYDHVARNLDMIEMQRDLLSGAQDVYLSAVANRTNQVMKALTVLGTISLPTLMISGIYGMNLQRMPIANHPYAAAIVLSAIAAVSAAVVAFMSRKRFF